MQRIILIVCLLAALTSKAQEQLGLRTDNYSGIHGSLLNPAHNVSSLFNWDINLISAGVSAHSNYGFLENTNLFHTLRNTDHIILRRDLEGSPNANALIADFENNSRLKYLTAQGNVMGPSFMARLKNGHSIGLFTNIRAAATSHDFPSVLNFNQFFDTPYFEYLDVDRFKFSAMIWSEVGLNYAHKFETNDGYIGMGANLKFINAHEAFYLDTRVRIPTAQVPNDTLLLQSPQLEYGVTKSNIEGEDIGVKTNGFGIGVDLGFTYVYQGNEDHYKWKIGASLLDLGQIELSKNAENHLLTTDSLITFPSSALYAKSNQERIYFLSNLVYQDSMASLNSSSFRMGLPGAISLQGDYFIAPHFYVNGVWVQRITMGQQSLRRNNILAATPRFEHRWFGTALPIVLLNYQKLNIGTSIRIGFLTIGSDDVTSLFGKSELESTDFYVALKINPFKLGLNLGGGRSNKGVKCYDF